MAYDGYFNPKVKYYKYVYEDWTQPVLSANGTMGGSSFAVSASSEYDTARPAYGAFDGVTGNDSANCWHSGSGFPSWIQFYNPKPLKVTKLTVTNRGSDGAFINSYGVSYSDDGETFTEFLTGTSSNQTANGSWEITIDNGVHKYWRLTSKSASGDNSDYTAVAEIDITAQEQTVVESTAADYDYREILSGKTKSIGIGSQNTNCLTHIPEDIKLDLDPLNVTVVGSPTISSGVVSGFSTANYLKIPSKFNTTDTWEIVGKFTTGSSFSSSMAIFHKEYALSVQISSDGKLDVYNWGSASHNYSSALSKNTTYWVKATVNGSTKARTVQYSTNGSTWTNVISNLTDSKLDIANTTYPAVFCGKSSIQDSLVFNGSISIPDTKIYKNGNLVWQGGTGQLTLKAGSKVYVPNGFSEQTETTVTKLLYACYTGTAGGYYYAAAPLNSDMKMYCNSDGSYSKVESPESLSNLYDLYWKEITEEYATLLETYTRYPSGDLTTTTTEVIPSGTPIFDEVVVESDVTGSHSSMVGSVLVTLNREQNVFNFTYLSSSSSGSSFTPATYSMYYDTANNIMKRYGSSTSSYTSESLPLAIVTSNKGYITSIDKIFNGFGYIGSTLFALKGVKGLIPDGFKENGTYKNIEFNLDRVVTKTFTHNPGATNLVMRSDGYLVDKYFYRQSTQPSKSYACWYNPMTNRVKTSGEDADVFNDDHYFYVADFTDDNATPCKITSLTINPVQPEMTTIPVKRIHKGADLIYIKQPVLLENNDTSTTTMYLESGVYELTLVGAGGGGGSGQGDSKWYQSSGGSGACFKGLVYLPKGTYTFVVGTPGYGWNVNGSANCDHAVEGTDSYVQYNGTTILTCGVGVCGRNRASGGAGGTLTIGDINVVSSEISSNGNKGNNINPGTVSSTSGYALSAYDNTKTGYGAGRGSWRYGGNVYGYDGYVKLEYVRAVI